MSAKLSMASGSLKSPRASARVYEYAVASASRCSSSRRSATSLPLERRHDHQVRAAERAADDQEQRDRERRADPAREAHPAVATPSRNRYPAPRTVRISSGSRASRSIFSRRCRTCTSIVRGSR